jgi:hypothetical protein
MTESDAMFPINLELINQLWLPNVYIYNLKTFKVQPLWLSQPPYLQLKTFKVQSALDTQRLHLQPQDIQGTTSSVYPTSTSTTSRHSRYNQLWLHNVYIYNLKTFKVQPALATQRLHLQPQAHSRYNQLWLPNVYIYNLKTFKVQPLWLPNVYIYNLKTFKVQPALASIKCPHLQAQNIQGTTSSGYPTSTSTTSRHSRYNQLWLPNVYIYKLDIQGTTSSGYQTFISTTSRHSRYNQHWLPNVYVYILKRLKVQTRWHPTSTLQPQTFKTIPALARQCLHPHNLKTFKSVPPTLANQCLYKYK